MEYGDWTAEQLALKPTSELRLLLRQRLDDFSSRHVEPAYQITVSDWLLVATLLTKGEDE